MTSTENTRVDLAGPGPRGDDVRHRRQGRQGDRFDRNEPLRVPGLRLDREGAVEGGRRVFGSRRERRALRLRGRRQGRDRRLVRQLPDRDRRHALRGLLPAVRVVRVYRRRPAVHLRAMPDARVHVRLRGAVLPGRGVRAEFAAGVPHDADGGPRHLVARAVAVLHDRRGFGVGLRRAGRRGNPDAFGRSSRRGGATRIFPRASEERTRSFPAQVFLLARVHEYRFHGRMRDRDATLEAVGRTGVVISAAGMIMAVAFSGLFLSKSTILNQAAFAPAREPGRPRVAPKFSGAQRRACAPALPLHREPARLCAAPCPPALPPHRAPARLCAAPRRLVLAPGSCSRAASSSTRSSCGRS